LAGLSDEKRAFIRAFAGLTTGCLLGFAIELIAARAYFSPAIGLSAYPPIGLLAYWPIGLLVYWSIGLLVYWSIGLLVYRSIGLSVSLRWDAGAVLSAEGAISWAISLDGLVADCASASEGRQFVLR
jgi:hypothetical protein